MSSLLEILIRFRLKKQFHFQHRQWPFDCHDPEQLKGLINTEILGSTSLLNWVEDWNELNHLYLKNRHFKQLFFHEMLKFWFIMFSGVPIILTNHLWIKCEIDLPLVLQTGKRLTYIGGTATDGYP
jgi:hypothetical protein